MSEKKPVLNLEELKNKYGKVYAVGVEIPVDDYTTDKKDYVFKKPSTASHDRYFKTASASTSKANRDFVLDSIVDEQCAILEADLEEYPALSASISEKLFGMLGLSRDTSLKKL